MFINCICTTVLNLSKRIGYSSRVLCNVLFDILQVISETNFPTDHLAVSSKQNQTTTKLQDEKPQQQLHKVLIFTET